jgi:hypothetical protein
LKGRQQRERVNRNSGLVRETWGCPTLGSIHCEEEGEDFEREEDNTISQKLRITCYEPNITIFTAGEATGV